jgi:hypothetical protein
MAYFIGPQLNEDYKDYLRRVLTDGGFYSRPNPKDFQNDVDTILPLNPILYTPANAGKVSKMYSLIPDTGAGDFTVSRNGTATYFDKDGLLKTAQADEPRFEFDPLTGDFKGVLVEPSASNLVLRSEEFTNSYWGKDAVTLTANAIEAPDGQMTGTLVETIDGGNRRIFRGIRVISDNTTYSISCFVKDNDTKGLSISIQFFNGKSSPNNFIASVSFRFSNKTISGGLSGTSGTGFLLNSYSNFFEEYPNGWVRFGMTFTTGTNANTTGGLLQFRQVAASGVDTIKYYLWGAQEEISLSPSSYIPTVASAVTRPADVISIPSYSALFGDRNSRLININGESKIFINEPDFQLPQGHNRFALEKDEFFTESEQTTLTATTVTYGVRDDIKQELNNVIALNPSLALIPGRGEATSLQTLIPNDGTGDFTVSRNGTATYFDKDGLLKTAQADEPRFEFDPLTGEFKGVLVESEQTNRIINNNTSLDIGIAYTTNTILNNEFGPSINGFYLEHGSGGFVNLGAYRIGNNLNTSFNTNIYTGFIVKNPSSNIMRVGVTFSLDQNWINFDDLTVNDSNTAKVIKIGTDSYFVILANTYTGGNTNSQFRAGLVGSFGSNISVAGNFIIGGLTVLRSNTAFSLDKINPIITTGSQVTRPADVISIPSYSALFGDRNSRLININGESKIFINEPDFQLPEGHNRFALEKDEFFTESEQTTLTATTVTYGVRDDIKQELNNVVALNPSLALIPGRGEATSLQTLIPNDGTGDFTVSRNGTATYFDKDGLLKTAQADEPRLEFDPLTGEFKGVLVEPTQTNFALRSQEFTDNYWGKARITVTGSATTAPDGTLTADKIVGNSDSNTHYIFRNISFSDQDIFTFSIFVKRAEYNFFNISDVQFSVFSNVRFDLINGITEIGPTTLGAHINSTIEDVGNGWYRCSITHPNPFGITYSFGGTPTFDSTLNYAGDNVSGVFIWGAQLERSPIATSYIPTVASEVTRPADIISLSNQSSLFGQSEGSIFFEFQNVIPSSLNINELLLPTSNRNSKVVFTYSTTEKKLYQDGILVGSSTGSFSYGTLDTLFLGSDLSGSGQFQNLNIKQYSTYNYVLSEEDTIKLTL